ncbi:unnamed protein product [Rotaria sp. Silwood2]|nr:unnamed protein product [Rotaria sp. Silwood2]CAF4356617.1 unnamed protein product [Rotaria sp. Silwood2]
MNNDDLVNMNSLDIWSFADQFRATVKSSTNTNNDRPFLTGMALGLNSTLSISEGNTKLPSCPMLLLSNSNGLLQVYYFIHKSLPSLYRLPEVIKQNQTLQSSMNSFLGMTLSSPSQTLPFAPVQSTTIAPSSSANALSLTNLGFTSSTLTTTNSQIKEKNINNILSSIQPPSQPANVSSIDDVSKSINMNNFNKLTSIQQVTPTKIATNNDQSSTTISNNKKLLQMTDEIQSKLKTLQKSLPKSSETSINLDESLENLIKELNNMTTSLQTSIQSIKTMTSEHIESITRIEDARHHLKLSQKENFYSLLKDRELDPWTQIRLDSIKNKYDQLKHNLNVLLQLTHKTIHNKSLSINNDDIENEDFLPDLEILETSETMKQGIQKRLLELSHKVSETEKDLQIIYAKFNKDFFDSKQFDSNLTKTTDKSSNRLFHKLDSEILLHLQSNHQNILEVHVPSTPVIQLSSINEQKKSSTIEITKPITPTTPIQKNSSPTIESESFKKMLRIVRASIDLYSGAASPEQLRELSNTISTSPLSSSIQKSNTISINKTPTTPKTTITTTTTTHTKSPALTKSLSTTIASTNILQSSAKTVTSSVPNISVTPATPAISSDIQSKLQLNKPFIQTPTDLSKTSGDSVIRSLLNNAATSSTTVTSNSTQPIINSTTNQIIRPNIPNTLTSQVTTPIPTTTATTTTSVQSISPTTKPTIPTGVIPFGSKPLLGSNTLNLTPTTSSPASFGNVTTTTNNIGSMFGSTSITTTSAPSPFGTATTTTTSTTTPFNSSFATPTTTTATTSASGTGLFGTATSSAATPFGIGFGTPTTTTTATATTPASGTGLFGTPTTSATSPFGTAFGTPTTTTTTTATTSASSTGLFGTATTAPISSPFGSGFATPPTNTTTTTTATTPTAGPFGSVFGAAVTTTAPSTGAFGSGFGNNTTTTSPFGSSFGATSITPTSTSNAPAFGSSGFPFSSTVSASTTAKSTTGTSLFGGGASSTPPFGNSFSGFGTHTSSSGPSTGFSFSGFGGAQPAEATPTPSSFGSFGSPTATSSASSPFGSSLFGGAAASGQTANFGPTVHSFGASSTQAANSPSFTTYRK